MSPSEFREALQNLRWSQRGLADALGMQERQVRRWATGEYAVPENIAQWLAKLSDFHRKNPPPKKPDRPLLAHSTAAE